MVDPITRLRPAKDSSVALMQAAQRAGLAVWVCTQADLSSAAATSGAAPGNHRPRAWAQPVHLAPINFEALYQQQLAQMQQPVPAVTN